MLIETVPEFQLKAKYRRKKPKSCARYPSCWRQPFTVGYHKLGPATLLLSNLGHVLSWKMSSTGKRKFWFSFLPAVQSWPLPKKAPLHPYRQSASVSMPFPTQLTRTSTSSSSFPFSFWSHGMWILGSPTRDQTFTPCSGRWILNHWTTKDVPSFLFWWWWDRGEECGGVFCIKASRTGGFVLTLSWTSERSGKISSIFILTEICSEV